MLLATVAWEQLLGNSYLGTVTWEQLLGNSYLGTSLPLIFYALALDRLETCL